MRVSVTVVTALLSGSALVAQVPTDNLTFDVVSIRLSTSESAGGTIGIRPGGRWFVTNVPVRAIISSAWGVPTDRVLNAPDWTTVERYMMEAVSPVPEPSQEQIRQMVRELLRDRFKLIAHTEKRDLPVYLLTVLRPDGQLGPRMRRSEIDCLDPEARKKAAAAIAAAAADGRIACGLRFEEGRYLGGGSASSVFEPLLTSATGRPVLDRTGLQGRYDFELRWAATLGGDAPPGDAVSIFTAVQEQLGLKLDSAAAPLDVVVIDRIERPSEN
jgi:uncharacterized protein (TIGR03435 family)